MLVVAQLTTYALVGIDALHVKVEVDTAHGLPKTGLLGLPEMAVKESIDRIELACESPLSTSIGTYDYQLGAR